MDNDEGHQTLVNYNQEGGGTECKDMPNIRIPTNFKSVTDSLQQGNMQNSETYSEMIYSMDMYSPRISETYSNMNTKESQQWRSLSCNRHSTTSTFSTSRRSTCHNDSYRSHSTGSQSEAHLMYLQSRITELIESEQADHIVVYEDEGEIGSCQSLDELSFDSEEDFSFLDNLKPQFNTLGKICSTQLDQVKRSKL
ncbi:hypothetical protein AMECASPLE_026963 [Ameca splendens]|uniref:Uncharacterized protein n=1 Tax=Ameca splendens TaxID=208324 RepID=A0ABV1A318_9TELE